VSRATTGLAAPDVEALGRPVASASVGVVEPDRLRIVCEDPDPERAAAVANALAALLVEEGESRRPEGGSADLRALEARMAEAQRTLEGQGAVLSQLAPDDARRAPIERERQNLQQASERLLGEHRRAVEEEARRRSAPQERLRVVAPARRPGRAAFPRLPLVPLGLLLGAIAGIGATLLLEARDPTIRDADALEALLGRTVLAEIPLVRPQGCWLLAPFQRRTGARRPTARQPSPSREH
jgi:hypothetical protein